MPSDTRRWPASVALSVGPHYRAQVALPEGAFPSILLLEGKTMAETVMTEPTASETAQLLAEIKKAFAEMDRLREQMRRDDLEIERSRAQTGANLASVDAILKKL
jgi:thiamine biosynthesis lipoprotein ApbE